MAHLHGELGRFAIRGAHALGVLHRERHGLFLVDVLAGFDGMDEVLAVQMLRRGDYYRVDGFVVEQATVVEIGGRVWNQGLGVFQALGVDIGKCDEVDIRAGQRPMDQLRSARTRPR